MQLDETSICLAPGPAAPEHHSHARAAAASSFFLLMLLRRSGEPVLNSDVIHQWPRQRSHVCRFSTKLWKCSLIHFRKENVKMTCAFEVSGDTSSIQGYVSNCMGSQVKLVNSCEQESTKKFSIRLNTFFCSCVQGEKAACNLHEK